MITKEELVVYKKVRLSIETVARNILKFLDMEGQGSADNDIYIEKGIVFYSLHFDEIQFPVDYLFMTKKQYLKLEEEKQRKAEELDRENTEYNNIYYLKQQYQHNKTAAEFSLKELTKLGIKME